MGWITKLFVITLAAELGKMVGVLVGKGADPDFILAHGRTLYKEAKAQGVPEEVMRILDKSELRASFETKLTPRSTPDAAPYVVKI